MWLVDYMDAASHAKFANDPRRSLGTIFSPSIQLSQCTPKSSAHRKFDVWGVKGSFRRPDADVNELKPDFDSCATNSAVGAIASY